MVTVTFMNSFGFDKSGMAGDMHSTTLPSGAPRDPVDKLCDAHTFCASPNRPRADRNGRKVVAMSHAFEADAFGKEFVDSGLRSFASLSKGIQAIALDATEYTRKSYEDGSAALQKLAVAKTPEAAFEIQSVYAKSAYEGFVAEATKMVDLYAELARDAYKPFEEIAPKAI
jgi:phasin family protein